MEATDLVKQNYLTTTFDNTGKRRKVTADLTNIADLQIKKILPSLMEECLISSARNVGDYRTYGSVGQINWQLAKIPWVACLKREVTKSTQVGFYIVLLFREDMDGCFLSLNQGYTQFDELWGSTVAQRKISQTAAIALSLLTPPPGFVTGQIDLKATSNLGRGYELGAIVSKEYFGNTPSEPNFRSDLVTLLNLYDELHAKAGQSLLDLLPASSDAEFQEAATEFAKPDESDVSLPPGPLPPPPKKPLSTGGRRVRNPKIAGTAIRKGGYACEIDATHQSFVAKRTGKNYVEAHHLVPMQFQDEFKVSLDVPENVTVLCPTCHRKLHHGTSTDKAPALKKLVTERAHALLSRGIKITERAVAALYKAELVDE
jgi:5-methylcytosine-specific restriction protein A